MKYVYLTNSPLRAIVDDEDYKLIYKHNWYLDLHGNVQTRIHPKTYGIHSIIMNTTQEIDHKNRNKLDNRKENLRICTRSQNECNRGPNNGRKYKGICWRESSKAWEVAIRKDGKRYYGGYFKTEEAAARAYDRLAKKYHGEFAYLNFPEVKEIQ
jgi:hypothetical protein